MESDAEPQRGRPRRRRRRPRPRARRRTSSPPRCARPAAPDASPSRVRRLPVATRDGQPVKGFEPPKSRWARRARWLALAGAALTPGAEAAPFEDTIAQRMLACTGCHGREGRAGPDGYYPRIAGKPAGYLYNQLRNFRDGRRRYELMNGLLALLDDAYLREIAEHFAGARPAVSAAAAAGETARLRDAARRSCARGDPAAIAARVQRLSWRRDDRRGAVRSRAARPAARLPQCAARRLAQRPTARGRARLHGRDRAPPGAARDRRRLVAGSPRSRCRPTPRPPRSQAQRCRCRAAVSRRRRRSAAGAQADEARHGATRARHRRGDLRCSRSRRSSG